MKEQPQTRDAKLFHQAGYPIKHLRRFGGRTRGQMLHPVKAKKVRPKGKTKRYYSKGG